MGTPNLPTESKTLFQALWELCILKYKCSFGKPKGEWLLVISRGNIVCWTSQMVGTLARERQLYKLTSLPFHCNCINFYEKSKVMRRTFIFWAKLFVICGIPKIELGTSRTLSENHATTPNALPDDINNYDIFSQRNANIFCRRL